MLTAEHKIEDTVMISVHIARSLALAIMIFVYIARSLALAVM